MLKELATKPQDLVLNHEESNGSNLNWEHRELIN